MSEAKPLLDDDAIERYARQIVVPGVGAAGQALICQTRIAAIGNHWGVDAALTYLAAAGAIVSRPPFPGPLDLVVLADAVTDADLAALPDVPDLPVAWYVLTDETVVGGLATVRDVPTVVLREMEGNTRDGPLAAAAHRIGGLDAASTAVASILGWCRPPERHTLGAIAKS